MPFAPKELIVKRLVAAHEAWYDVFTDYEFAGRTFDAYCEFHSHGEKYVLVKRAKLWEVNAHEYLFIDALDHLDAGTLDSYVEFMETRALEKVDPVPNHMQSSRSLVIVADRVDDEAKRACRKTRFRKNFALGIRGWADLRLAVVDIAGHDVVTNGAGKEMKASLEANARADEEADGHKEKGSIE